MEEKKSTLIPHESHAPKKRIGNFFFFFSVGVLILSGVVSGGAYFLRKNAEAKVVSYKEALDRSNERFAEGLPIRSIEEFDLRLRSARDILSKHKSFSGIFSLLERVTLKDVQFVSFSYTEVENTKKNVVRLIGLAPNYKTIAEQSEQFSLDEEARRYITDVVFSNLSVDTKDTGLISFEVMFTVDPEFLAYSRYVRSSFPITDGINSPRDAVPIIKNQ